MRAPPMPVLRLNVAAWHRTDMLRRSLDVRSWGKNRQSSDAAWFLPVSMPMGVSDCSSCLMGHGDVLLVLLSPRSFSERFGREHGRSIPFSDVAGLSDDVGSQG